MECHLDKAPQKCYLQDLMVQNVVEKLFFEIGRSYRPKILIPYSRA